MLWIPAVLLGIDLAVRDGRPSGGVLAGCALLCASWTDSHIFFFGALAAPCWTLIAVVSRPNGDTTRQSSWQQIFAALLPVPLFLGGALAFPTLMQTLAGTNPAGRHLAAAIGARLWREIALYSPKAEGFFGWLTPGTSNHIYLGRVVVVFLAVGLACLLFDAVRQRKDLLAMRRIALQAGSRRRLRIMVLLLAGMLGVMALALGTNGPAHAVLLRICRKIIPPYAFIRQPAKIFCLMPSLLAVAAGISLSAIWMHLQSSRIKIFTALVFCAAVMGEYVLRVHPTVSILDAKQGAYEAVAQDAAAAGKAPHALVITLWPGDSHYSSVYQYYASLYRIRMVNGYNPFVSKSYFENVFRRYESVNQGWLTDQQINELQRRKIDYIILHEDLFPEKVSPFPVGWTLQQLLAHQRLQLLRQDGRVWAFKMLAGPRAGSKTITADWKIFGCARTWPAAVCAKGSAQVIRNASSPASGSYAVLNASESWLLVPALRVAPAPQLRWMLRVRGAGAIVAENAVDGKPFSRELIDIQSDEWEWIDIPVPSLGVFAPLDLKIAWESGSVDCARLLLAANEWVPPAIGQTLDLPAPGMFHAGYTRLADDTVVLEKEREAKVLVFYGPKLPIENGSYRIELVFNSDAPRGVLLGQFNVQCRENDCILNWIPVMAGARSLTEFTQLQNVSMYLEFLFLGNGSLAIKSLKLTRLK